MSLSVEEILKNRHNDRAVKCVKGSCSGVENYNIGYHTNMLFCKIHKWKEVIAQKGGE